MDSVFNGSTTAQIDAKLYRDTLNYQYRLEKITIVSVIVLMFMFRGWIAYWLKFGIAIPSGFTNSEISLINDPVQKNYSKDLQKAKTFTYKSLISKTKVELIPQAHYTLSGRVVAFNHDFLLTKGYFDKSALYDLGATWGKDMSEPQFFKKYFKIYSQKVELTGSRILYWQWKYDTPLTEQYITSHISHTHIIPANNNVMAAMLKLKLYDKVKIEGELVDMKFTSHQGAIPQYTHTSLSRTDTEGSACETMYVTKVQIGNFIYK